MFIVLAALAVLLVVLPMLFYGHICIRRAMGLMLPARKKTAKLLTWALTAVFLLGALCVFSVSALFALYFVLFSALADLLFLLIRALFRGRAAVAKAKKLLRCGVLPLGLTCVFLGAGAVNMAMPHNVSYELTSEKLDRAFELCFISDTHFGTVQSPEILEEHCRRLSALEPDALILGGDIVEEATSREDLERAFEILGSVKTEYGVYYVFGNHDRATYSPAADFGEAELLSAIKAAGITVLRDSSVSLPCGVSIVGREDASVSGRAEISSLVEGLPEGDLVVVADHQPREGAECAGAGVDLLISGHTHSGQIWPLGWFFRLANSPVYGEYDFGDCKMIVSSGFTGWGYPVRTQGRCEAVVVSVRPE